MLRLSAPTSAEQLALLIKWVFPRLLGLIFVVTAAQKVRSPGGIEAVFRFDGMPESLIQPAVWTVIGIEFLLAAWLMSFLWLRRAAMMTAIIVLLGFSLQIGILLLFKEAPNCGCLGELIEYESARKSNALSLVRNICLLIPSFWTWAHLPKTPAGQGFPVELAENQQ